jgi:hypothetical protein
MSHHKDQSIEMCNSEQRFLLLSLSLTNFAPSIFIEICFYAQWNEFKSRIIFCSYFCQIIYNIFTKFSCFSLYTRFLNNLAHSNLQKKNNWFKNLGKI